MPAPINGTNEERRSIASEQFRRRPTHAPQFAVDFDRSKKWFHCEEIALVDRVWMSEDRNSDGWEVGRRHSEVIDKQWVASLVYDFESPK
jgi:hypothetical protein